MALIFHDTLQARDSTGLYTLMANINGEWTDIHTVAGAQNGTIEIDAGINTIAVDTDMLPVGQTFQFKWVDSLGNESNIVSALVPFTILDYYTSNEDITYVNNGGDSWTFTVPYTPPPNQLADTLSVQIVFYSATANTTLVNTTGFTSAQSYTLSGNGDGTYNVIVFYMNQAGDYIAVSQAFIMVAAGAMVREAILSGFSDVSYSGMYLSCTANVSATNATVIPASSYYLALDDTYNNPVQLSVSNPMTDQLIPSYGTQELSILYMLGLDNAEWTTGVVIGNGNLIACAMTLTTNIS